VTPSISVGARKIGPGLPVFVVAELSGNHKQSFDEAVNLVRAAKECGADAVKLQTYTADTMTIACDSDYFRVIGGTPWDGRTLHDIYGEAYTPWRWQPELQNLARTLELELFSTLFDASAVEFLEVMNVPAYKIASFEIVDLPLIEKVARTGKPLIISTGMATEEEIEAAVKSARGAGATQIALLKCTSSYPADPSQMNLRTIPYLAEKLQVPVGLSDHTLGVAVPVAAVALGACIIEKHLTLSRAAGGPDSAFSLEPEEFAAMVDAVRTTERALGSVPFACDEKESRMRTFRRSIFVTEDVSAGSPLTTANIRIIRPGHGLAPTHYQEVLGRRVKKGVQRGTPLTWDLLD